MIYLSVPYSNPCPLVREYRFREANKAACALFQQGAPVFSPISQCHPIALEGALPLGWEFWAKYDEEMISHCSMLVVLKLEGWEDSTGVQAEIKIAKRLEIPVLYWGTDGIKPIDEPLIYTGGN